MKRIPYLALIVVVLILSCCKKEGPEVPVIVQPSVPDEALCLESFDFLTTNNKALAQDAIGRIAQDAIYLECPDVKSVISIIPTFSGSFNKIELNGKAIESDKDACDFSGEPQVKIYDSKGKSVVYRLYITLDNLVPRVRISTSGEITSRTEYIPATIRINNVPEYGNIEASGKARGRGNATFLSYPKKAYRFKLDAGQSVCGLPKNRDWVLLAEYCDCSLMRTTWMNAMSKAVGADWTPLAKHVDLYLNDSYNGTYLLIEQVEKAKDKVVIDDDGFFIENDNYASWEPLYFTTNRGVNYTFKYPSPDDGEIIKDDAKYKYIKGFMNNMEAALYGTGFKDPDTGYRKYLDVDSFVKWYLIMEILACHDPNFYYVLPQVGGKLKMYPAWDAEWTLGNASAGPGGWQTYPQTPIYTEVSEMYRTRRYFEPLFKDPYFVGKVHEAWLKLRPRLDEVRNEVREEENRTRFTQVDNFKRWPVLGQVVSVNLVIFKTWEDAIAYNHSWFDARVNWFDTYIQELYESTL